MSDQPQPFGVDFGGSGIKGAPVNTSTGEFAAERQRIETPKPATPEAVADVVAKLVDRPEVSSGPPPTSTTAGSASTPTRSSPSGWDDRSPSSTTPTPRGTPRRSSVPP